MAVLVTAAGLVAVPSAQADESRPTDIELLEKCDNGTKKCVFHPAGDVTLVPGEREAVGDRAWNCTPDQQTSSRTWEHTTGESNSLGVSLRTEVGTKAFGAVFKIAFEASYKRTWSSSRTEGETTFIDVPPGEVGWVTVASKTQKVSGTYELIFKDRFHGKRYWYVPFEAEGPAEDEPAVRSQRSRPMTEQERVEECT
ncbi:hypothetical protein G3I50_05405 [Streptomyces parvus]|uniref:Uncharacterized protein n=1 Tax=Streptomyces parvus TaxID=66428 RepID=A0A7K3RR33_9ACTN|nr:hypothetical protein [Streptomyces parvus]